MTVELRPEDQELTLKRLTSGAFKTAGEVIHDALISQDTEESRLRENRGAIYDKIQRGRAQLARGEGIPGEVATQPSSRWRKIRIWGTSVQI